jgi:rhodanese-related sulfurtransferase
MNILKKTTIFAMTFPMLAAISPAAVWADDPEPVCDNDIPNENRKGICGNYHSEISPAEAFLNTVVNRGKGGKGNKRDKHSKRPVLIDVRSTPEYKAGHPEYSYNAPSPFIYQYCNDVGEPGPHDDRRPDGACISGGERIDQPGEDFVAYVESIVPNKDTPIYTMCRTGVRSVGAAELLTEAGYTEVRNIWEGFVGIYLTAPFQDYDADANDGEGGYVVGPVDLNHDGQLTDDDKNGWRNHQGLPYETKLKTKQKYTGNFSESYDWD